MTENATSASLERAYTRLLAAYPSGYRRLRGVEILGVLMDGSRSGQRYPRVREAGDILAAGLRERLGLSRSPGFLDGLRVALPVALVLAVALSAGVRIGGLDSVPRVQPYVYAWAVAAVAWAVSPFVGRIAVVLAALATIRLAAAWSYGFPEVFAACVMSAVAAAAAIAAPREASRTKGHDLASALWRWPGRVAALSAAAMLGILGQVLRTEWMPAAPLVVVVVVLAAAGAVAAARRHGVDLLWAAGVLAPAAVAAAPALVDPSPYQLVLSVPDGQGHPWFLLRQTVPGLGGIIVPIIAATMAVVVLVALAAGRWAAQRTAATLTRATLVSLAVITGLLELVSSAPSWAVTGGCALFAATALATARIPRPLVLITLLAAAIMVLGDIGSPARHGRPWPLFALAMLGVLALVQTWVGAERPRLWSTVAGTTVISLLMGGLVYKATFSHGANILSEYPASFSNIQHEPLVLVLPAFAAALVAATTMAVRMPARTAILVAVALSGLLWIAAPIRDLTVVAVVGLVGAVLTVLVGQFLGRLGSARDDAAASAAKNPA